MSTIHLCLVSDQLPANLIPALKLRPTTVWLASSKRMLSKAHLLRRLLKKESIACEIILEDLSDSDIETMKIQACDIAFKLSERTESVVLNATGGNKLMTISFYNELLELLRERLLVVYCDTQNNSLAHIFPEPSQENLGQILDLTTYLSAYDYRVSHAASDDDGWKRTSAARKQLTKWLGGNLHRDAGLIGMLNGAASKANECMSQGDMYGARQAFRSELWGLRLETLREMSKNDLIEWHEGADAILFKSTEAARYVSGGWLEEYAWHCAVDAGAHDARCGIIVKRDDTENELDCAVIHNNRMLVIECKTAAITADGKGAQDVLHKLDNLSTHLGGLFAERMLLSVRGLREDEAHIRSRAKSYNIKLIDGISSSKLKEEIRRWMNLERPQ